MTHWTHTYIYGFTDGSRSSGSFLVINLSFAVEHERERRSHKWTNFGQRLWKQLKIEILWFAGIAGIQFIQNSLNDVYAKGINANYYSYEIR